MNATTASFASPIRRLVGALPQQYYSVGEQLLTSGTNMLLSLIVVKVAGVAAFGIYSFLFVLCSLGASIVSALLHRQMLLEISTVTDDGRQRLFLSTLAMQAVAMAVLALVAWAALTLFADTALVSSYRGEIVAAVTYVALFGTHDLWRQYLYATDHQGASLACSIVSSAVSFAVIGLCVLALPPSEFVRAVYLASCLGFLASAASNVVCRRALADAQWVGWRRAGAQFTEWFEQGRFRLVGVGVTWVQNQSMNPFLMWAAGPLAAGWFSLARLLVMPMSVVNQGVTNSTTPELRRIYTNDGIGPLQRRIDRLYRLNTIFSLAYSALLALAWATGLLDRFVPDWMHVRWYLGLWLAILAVTMYRFWQGQFFVVTMRFRFLMRVSIVAATVSLTGMVTTAVVFDHVVAALWFIVIGEALSVLLFSRERRKLFAEADRTDPATADSPTC